LSVSSERRRGPGLGARVVVAVMSGAGVVVAALIQQDMRTSEPRHIIALKPEPDPDSLSVGQNEEVGFYNPTTDEHNVMTDWDLGGEADSPHAFIVAPGETVVVEFPTVGTFRFCVDGNTDWCGTVVVVPPDRVASPAHGDLPVPTSSVPPGSTTELSSSTPTYTVGHATLTATASGVTSSPTASYSPSATVTSSVTATGTNSATATEPATRTDTPTPTATATERLTDTPSPTPGPTPIACPHLDAPADEIADALAHPETIGGWGQLCDEGKPWSPMNGYRTSLMLMNPNVPYDSASNRLIFRCGCR
jgi:hypothetical protein